MAQNIYESITNKVIEGISNGILPWQKPWADVMGNLAISYVTRKPYSFLNQFFLEGGEYLTLAQVNKLGGKVKKGSHSHIVYGFFRSYKNLEDGTYTNDDMSADDNYRVIWSMRYFKVFNVLDCEGISPKGNADAKPLIEHTDDIANADDAIECYVARECHNGFRFHNAKESNRAFYQPSADMVVVPCKGQYANIVEYYSTTFHELTHSTGAEKRLNREGIVNGDGFGHEKYSQEELVAELGAAMMLGVLGIEDNRTFDNSLAYLQSWSKAMKDKPKMIVYAAAQAENAVKFILGKKK